MPAGRDIHEFREIRDMREVGEIRRTGEVREMHGFQSPTGPAPMIIISVSLVITLLAYQVLHLHPVIK